MKKISLVFLFSMALIGIKGQQINLLETPFSCKGSYMALSTYDEEQGEKLYLRDICGRRMWKPNNVFRLEPIHNGKILEAEYTATATKATIKTDGGTVAFCYESPDALRIKGKNTGMRLTLTAPYDGSALVIPVKKGQWRLQMGGFPHFVFTTLNGNSKLVEGTRLAVQLVTDHYERPEIKMIIDIYPDETGNFDAVFEQYFAGWEDKPHPLSFNECEKKIKQDFNDWCNKTPSPVPEYRDTWLLANYINWSCVVDERGLITTPMMLSSKNAMHAIWSWDNCFFSMAMAYKMPKRAWDQYYYLYTLQDETGCFPNMTTEVNYMWGFGTPQLFGWSLRRMFEVNPGIATTENLEKIYEPLGRAVDFWFKYQDDDHDSIPQYNHCNESGMDNSTAFDMGMSAESPDLCAYLVTEMDLLADIAKQLKKPEADYWKTRADVLLDKMIKNLWIDGKFVARRTDNGEYNENSGSILSYMPLILGKRLPDSISNKMINDLKTNGQFTDVGLASENPNTSLYVEDSYWRGPVWSPPTLIISHGIKECGDEAFAKEIAKRYCDNCKKNGFGENFDPFTGASLKDKSLPWTAAIFVILMEEFLK